MQYFLAIRRDTEDTLYTRTFACVNTIFFIQFESLLLESICHLLFFPVGDRAQISAFCLLTVLPETQMSQNRSIHNQISDVFSSSYDPVDHARRPRCPAQGWMV